MVGYKAGMFGYLKDKYGVSLAYNEDYYRYNNTSSLMRVLDRLGDTYICSSDNLFPRTHQGCHNRWPRLLVYGGTCLFFV